MLQKECKWPERNSSPKNKSINVLWSVIMDNGILSRSDGFKVKNALMMDLFISYKHAAFYFTRC